MGGMRYQPQSRLRLNTRNPLSRGLVGLWLPTSGGFVSAIPGVPNAAITSAARFVGGPRGLLIGTTGGASATIANSAKVKPTAAITVLVDGIMPTTGYPLGCENSNDGWGLYPLNGVLRPYLRVGSAWADRPSAAALGSASQVGFSFDGTTFRAIANGKQGDSQAISGAITNSSVGIAINAMNPAGASAGNGSIRYFALWDRALSASELASFYANPWQLFAPQDVGEEAAALGGGAITITPASLPLSGGQVGARVSRRVAVQPTGLGLDGGPTSLAASRRIGVQPAPLAVATGNVAMTAARKLEAGAADLALQAGAARLRADRRLTVAPVAMAVTGSSIQFQYTPAPEAGSYVMAITPAPLSLTAGNVAIRVARRLPAVPAGLVLGAGSVRTLAARRLMVSPVALATVAGQVLLRADRRLQVEPAQLVVTGGAATFRYGQQIEYARAPVGSGYAPQRVEVQARPAQLGGYRPASIQRNNR